MNFFLTTDVFQPANQGPKLQLLVRSGSHTYTWDILTVASCRGLKYVAKDRVERLRALADLLSTCDYDIIALQEIWVHADFQAIRNAVLKNLPYSKYFYSGALGSGLALFSRFPITGSSIIPYHLNGSPLDVAGGDFFVGKSITSIIVEHPALGEVEVFNTHVSRDDGCRLSHFY